MTRAGMLKGGDTDGKDKPAAILVIQQPGKVARRRINQSFSAGYNISFPPLHEGDGEDGPMIIEAEIGGHEVHRIYVDGGSSSEVIFEHCFSRLQPEIRK